MKQIFALAIIILCTTSLRAQDESYTYRPFVEEGKVWDFYDGKIHYIQGDTIVANHPCKKWIQQDVTFDDKSTIVNFELYVYEEDKKVWFFYPGDTIPRLFFDFGAQVGDTICAMYCASSKLYTCNNPSNEEEIEKQYKGYPAVIHKTGTALDIDGHVHKLFWYSYLNPISLTASFMPYMFVIEGIGGYMEPNILDYGGMCTYYMCRLGDKIIYQRDLTFLEDVIDVVNADQIVNCKWSNGKLFDLSGRRLSAPPARGVYIEDGKKIIK